MIAKHKIFSSMFTALAFAGAGTASGAEIIAEIEDRPFGLHASRSDRMFGCSRYDQDDDGTRESTVVWVRLGTALGARQAPGILQTPYVEQRFEDPEGTICARMTRIEESLAQTFGAVYGTFDSVVRLGETTLEEELAVTLVESGPTENPATVTVTGRTVKELD